MLNNEEVTEVYELNATILYRVVSDVTDLNSLRRARGLQFSKPML